MSFLRILVSLMVASSSLGACARPPADRAVLTETVLAVSPRTLVSASSLLSESMSLSEPWSAPGRLFSSADLAGRTMAVAATSDIQLRPGEVILTFDDGPRVNQTPKMLDILDRYGVKATFLMLGAAAQANPQLAQQVALRGHSVGSHTFDHIDLTTLSQQAALDEIDRGERAVANALASTGKAVAPFFRFPYLAQTGLLRASLMQGNMVILDVDIDSKDYYRETPQTIAARTLARLDTRGSGIILFHDIHQRTVETLPIVLDELKRRGYSVVRLVPRRINLFERNLITANMAGDSPLL